MTSMSRLVSLVTGASSGIGESIAIMLAKRGASVTLTGRDHGRLEAAKALCVEASGGHSDRFLAVAGDVTEASTRADILQQTIDTFGRLDVLVPNAGVALPGGDIRSATEQVFDTTMDVNMKSVFFLIQAATPHLEASKGNIVVISAVASHIAIPFLTSYAMSKAAIDHMVRCLAVDLGPKSIRVNGVNPGYVPTRVFRNIINSEDANSGQQVDALTAAVLAQQPLNNGVITSECVAEAVSYFASPAASFVTGQCLLVDAGGHLKGSFNL